MSALAIFLVGLAVLLLAPAALIPVFRRAERRDAADSRLEDVAAAGTREAHHNATVPVERHRRAYMRLGRVVLQKVDAATEFPVTDTSNTMAAGRFSERGPVYRIEPQRRRGCRRHVPHQDGLADVPLQFHDRHGGRYTMTCRLYVN